MALERAVSSFLIVITSRWFKTYEITPRITCATCTNNITANDLHIPRNTSLIIIRQDDF